LNASAPVEDVQDGMHLPSATVASAHRDAPPVPPPSPRVVAAVREGLAVAGARVATGAATSLPSRRRDVGREASPSTTVAQRGPTLAMVGGRLMMVGAVGGVAMDRPMSSPGDVLLAAISSLEHQRHCERPASAPSSESVAPRLAARSTSPAALRGTDVRLLAELLSSAPRCGTAVATGGRHGGTEEPVISAREVLLAALAVSAQGNQADKRLPHAASRIRHAEVRMTRRSDEPCIDPLAGSARLLPHGQRTRGPVKSTLPALEVTTQEMQRKTAVAPAPDPNEVVLTSTAEPDECAPVPGGKTEASG